MKPKGGHGEQQRRPHGRGQRGGQQPAVADHLERDDLHLEPVFGGHAAEDAFPQGRVHRRPQDAEVAGEEARVILDAVVLFPAVGGVEGTHRAGQEDGGVERHRHLLGGGATQLEGCWRTVGEKGLL